MNDGWSLIFHRFGSCNRQMLVPAFASEDSVDSLIAKLKAKCLDIGADGVERCFDCIFGEGFDATRPGMALIVLHEIEILVGEPAKTLIEILQRIFSGVQAGLGYRKPNMKDDDAQLPKLGLLVPHAYRQTAPQADDPDEEMFNYKSFMNNHMYHLLEPANFDKPFFLTFKPDMASSSLRYFNPDSAALKQWTLELTKFNKSEFFTIMSCLHFPFPRSTTTCLKLGYSKFGVSGWSLADVSNPAAQKRSGNRMEVYAAVGIANSTHFEVCEDLDSADCLAVQYGISGQRGKSFLTNLLRNSIYLERFIPNLNEFTVELAAPLENWLSSGNIHFPFLNGIDLDASTPAFDALTSLSVLGNYSRCPDADKIDGFFLFRESGIPVGCSVECKNTVVLDVSTLNTALVKAFDMNKKIVAHQVPPKLILIFCHKIDPAATAKNALNAFCTQNPTLRINLYRAAWERGRIVVKPFLLEWELVAEPACHAIVIPLPLATLN
jgi:hypothetical protein